YTSLRSVPAYPRFIRERFERCLDLYLCPRVKKNRIMIDPDALLPKLPKRKDLRPFPHSLSLRYLGHRATVRSLSLHPSGQWMASGMGMGADRDGVMVIIVLFSLLIHWLKQSRLALPGNGEMGNPTGRAWPRDAHLVASLKSPQHQQKSTQKSMALVPPQNQREARPPPDAEAATAPPPDAEAAPAALAASPVPEASSRPAEPAVAASARSVNAERAVDAVNAGSTVNAVNAIRAAEVVNSSSISSDVMRMRDLPDAVQLRILSLLASPPPSLPAAPWRPQQQQQQHAGPVSLLTSSGSNCASVSVSGAVGGESSGEHVSAGGGVHAEERGEEPEEGEEGEEQRRVRAAVAEMMTRGYAVLDGFMGMAEAVAARAEAEQLRSAQCMRPARIGGGQGGAAAAALALALGTGTGAGAGLEEEMSLVGGPQVDESVRGDVLVWLTSLPRERFSPDTHPHLHRIVSRVAALRSLLHSPRAHAAADPTAANAADGGAGDGDGAAVTGDGDGAAAAGNGGAGAGSVRRRQVGCKGLAGSGAGSGGAAAGSGGAANRIVAPTSASPPVPSCPLDLSGKFSCQLACYPGNGARYARHTDRSPSSPHRRVTALYYLNPAWDPASMGGNLRLYLPRASHVGDSGAVGAAAEATDEAAAAAAVRTGMGHAYRAGGGGGGGGDSNGKHRKGGEEVEEKEEGEEGEEGEEKDQECSVDIAPLADRLLLFLSHIPHEVLPSHTHRFSLTFWFCCSPHAQQATSEAPLSGVCSTDGPHSHGHEERTLQGGGMQEGGSGGLGGFEMSQQHSHGHEERTLQGGRVQRGGREGLGGVMEGRGLLPTDGGGASDCARGGGGEQRAGEGRTGESSRERIFVSIASYRDSECVWTVRSLLENAAVWQRVTVGIVWQIAEEDCAVTTEALLCSLPACYHSQIRQVVLPACMARGPCWARAIAQHMWQGEEYYLQVGIRWAAVGGRWAAGGWQVGGRWAAGGRQVGGRWVAGGWQLSCLVSATDAGVGVGVTWSAYKGEGGKLKGLRLRHQE
ncbi:unnamed protein product, partial [Closterium sp. NIES-54]